MEYLIYSSNGDYSLLKDMGPYRQQLSDNSDSDFPFIESSKQIIVGKVIEVKPLIVNSPQINKNEETTDIVESIFE